MTPAGLVDGLYRLVLGRPADPEGLAHWQQRAPSDVLAALLASDEYAARAAQSGDDLVKAALSRLNRLPRIVDVGAQTHVDGVHPYTPLLEVTPADVVGFDPLSERLQERADLEGRTEGSLTLLPYALGDGGTHTLYVNNDDATSSLFPLNTAHNAAFNHLHTLRTVETRQVQTRRLDDVLPAGPVDLLKLDVQGAELMVLQGGRDTVSRAAVVHCEVEFAPIYVGQPLFPDIHAELDGHGFYLVDLLVPHLYHYVGTGRESSDRLLWADAVFLRDVDDLETRAAQALIAASMYGKLSLAAALLGWATGRAAR